MVVTSDITGAMTAVITSDITGVITVVISGAITVVITMVRPIFIRTVSFVEPT